MGNSHNFPTDEEDEYEYELKFDEYEYELKFNEYEVELKFNEYAQMREEYVHEVDLCEQMYKGLKLKYGYARHFIENKRLTESEHKDLLIHLYTKYLGNTREDFWQPNSNLIISCRYLGKTFKYGFAINYKELNLPTHFDILEFLYMIKSNYSFDDLQLKQLNEFINMENMEPMLWFVDMKKLTPEHMPLINICRAHLDWSKINIFQFPIDFLQKHKEYIGTRQCSNKLTLNQISIYMEFLDYNSTQNYLQSLKEPLPLYLIEFFKVKKLCKISHLPTEFIKSHIDWIDLKTCDICEIILPFIAWRHRNINELNLNSLLIPLEQLNWEKYNINVLDITLDILKLYKTRIRQICIFKKICKKFPSSAEKEIFEKAQDDQYTPEIHQAILERLRLLKPFLKSKVPNLAVFLRNCNYNQWAEFQHVIDWSININVTWEMVNELKTKKFNLNYLKQSQGSICDGFNKTLHRYNIQTINDLWHENRQLKAQLQGYIDMEKIRQAADENGNVDLNSFEFE